MTAATVSDNVALKVHTARDKTVWFADGDLVPIATGVAVDTFVKRLATGRPAANLRVLGTADNATLIVALYQRFAHGGGCVEVASPLICETAEERQDAAIVLYRMRQCVLPASVGGWHTVSPLDYPAYAISAQFQKDNDHDHIQRLLETHPAWHDLQFLPNLSYSHCARLISEIRDPRWYIDPVHPERVGRLRSHLGLCPAMQEQVYEERAVSRLAQRCQLVRDCWRTTVPTPEMLARPEYFLWRVYFGVGGGARGELKASRAFIAFLRHTWMQALYATARWSRDRELFAPALLLKRREIEAYAAHVAARD